MSDTSPEFEIWNQRTVLSLSRMHLWDITWVLENPVPWLEPTEKAVRAETFFIFDLPCRYVKIALDFVKWKKNHVWKELQLDDENSKY